MTGGPGHESLPPPGGWLADGGTEANATAANVQVSGHTVYGVYTTGSFSASRKALQPVVLLRLRQRRDGHKDDGNGTMEAVYFGNSTQWGKGTGPGPWVMADLENGVFAGESYDASATNTPLVASFVTAMVKGKPGSFALKGADAQSGGLKTMYDGPRPSGYDPMKKQGAIILGIGGDNSHTGEGTFFEGCVVSGYPADATDDAVQANVVAAGYGR